uniref:Uncharacterized protein n=1 Tax=Romanomermis culicivorax TaxID=13658 RepID=A0A915INB9_ROMCU
MMKSYFYPIKFLLVVVCCPNADLRSPILLIAPVLQVGLSGPCLVFNDTNIDLIECFDSRTIYDRILLNSRKNIIHHGLNPLNDHISLSITCFNGSEKSLLNK